MATGMTILAILARLVNVSDSYMARRARLLRAIAGYCGLLRLLRAITRYCVLSHCALLRAIACYCRLPLLT